MSFNFFLVVVGGPSLSCKYIFSFGHLGSVELVFHGLLSKGLPGLSEIDGPLVVDQGQQSRNCWALCPQLWFWGDYVMITTLQQNELQIKMAFC